MSPTEQQRGDRRAGRRLRLGRRRDRQDDRPRRALRAARSASEGSTSTRCSSSRTRERAAGELRRASASGCANAVATTWPASWTGPGSRRSTASATGCCRRIRSRPGSTRASACSTTARARCSAARLSTRRSRSSAANDPERLRLLAAYGGTRLRRMLTGVHETLRSAGRALRLELGAAARARRARRASCAARGTPTDERGTQRCARRSARARALLDLSELRARGEPPSVEEARQAVEQAALEALAARDRACCRSSCSMFAAPTAPPRTASRRSTSRTSSCLRATCSGSTRRSASARAGASARSWSTSSRTRTASSAS